MVGSFVGLDDNGTADGRGLRSVEVVEIAEIPGVTGEATGDDIGSLVLSSESSAPGRGLSFMSSFDPIALSDARSTVSRKETAASALVRHQAASPSIFLVARNR